MRIMKNKKINDMLLATAVLITGLCVAIFFACRIITTQSEKTCYSSLKTAAIQMVYEIEKNEEYDLNQVSAIAKIFSRFDSMDDENIVKSISGFERKGSIEHLELLLPDNTIITGKGKITKAPNELSFDEEKTKGQYISDKTSCVTHSSQKVLRCAAPILKNNEVQAVLYGVIKLEKLSERYKPEIYMGKANAFIIDDESGDFIMDTWNNSLGKLSDIKGRRLKRGYSAVDLYESILARDSGYSAFKSADGNEYLYAYYAPLGINSWTLMLTVPESIVFESTHKMQIVLYSTVVAMLILVALYCVWLVNRGKKEKADMHYMLEIERTLFSAHRHNENMTEALAIVADRLKAETAFYVDLKNEKIRHVYSWSRIDDMDLTMTEGKPFYEVFPQLASIFGKRESRISYGNAVASIDVEAGKYDVDSYMITSVKGEDNELVGALGVLNLDKKWSDASALENVALTFLVASDNLHTYRKIKKLSVIDSLTNVQNRNCFENLTEQFDGMPHKQLTCGYIDVNGLHELNNLRGHESGDRMLKTVANVLKTVIGEECVFRIGGDEFLVFIRLTDAEEASNMLYRAKDAVEKKGYSIALGIAYSDGGTDINALVKCAEHKMRKAKYNYYKDKGENAARL